MAAKPPFFASYLRKNGLIETLGSEIEPLVQTVTSGDINFRNNENKCAFLTNAHLRCVRPTPDSVLDGDRVSYLQGDRI